MYFASRVQAGRMLASQLTKKYRYENCAVVSLGDGGVMVGAQIAVELHCILTMLASAEIMLPREPQAIAGITSGGTVSYNHAYSDGELDEMVGENYGFIEQEKLIAAVPFASVQAVDRMHVQADELYCLDVIQDYIETDHYYDVQDVPDHETVLKTLEN